VSKSLKKESIGEAANLVEFPHNLDHLQRPGVNLRTRLTTTGRIKSELGKLYRGVRNGKIDLEIARTCAGILRIMLKSTEQEHMFALAADDPDDDTPSLVGVTIIGPGATKTDLKKLKNSSTPTRKRGSE